MQYMAYISQRVYTIYTHMDDMNCLYTLYIPCSYMAYISQLVYTIFTNVTESYRVLKLPKCIIRIISYEQIHCPH